MRHERTLSVCETCKQDFTPLRQSAGRFCSAACANAGASRPTACICSHCGVGMLRRPGQIRPRVYCSPACRSVGQKVTLTCEGCSVSFAVSPYRKDRAKFCSTICHYETVRNVPLSERFEARIVKSDGCWSLDVVNYGQIRVNGAKRGLHCIAWELASGQPIPDGLVVCHTCDHRDCVRNDEAGTYEVRGAVLPRYGHLFLGTPEQNTHDMIDKERFSRGDRQ